MRNPTRPFVALALSAALLLGVLAASALAGQGTTATATVALTSPQPAGAVARCAKKTHATGGGFRVAPGYDPVANNGARSLTQVSAPVGPRAWEGYTAAFGTAVPATLTEYARCAPNKQGNVTVTSESAVIAPEQATTLEPRCPPVRRLVGGGFRVNPGRNFSNSSGALIFVLESRRDGGRDWRVTGANVNLANSVPGTLTAYALCASDQRKMRVAKTTVPLAYNQRASAVATCPPKFHTVSGGFKASPAFDTPAGDFILPFFDASAPLGSNAWEVSAFRAQLQPTPAEGAITAYAYCEEN